MGKGYHFWGHLEIPLKQWRKGELNNQRITETICRAPANEVTGFDRSES